MSQADIVTFDQDPLLATKQLIEITCTRLKSHGCSSATVIVRDQLLPFYWRSIADCGIEYREFLHGPFSTETAIGELITEDDRDWVGPKQIQQFYATSEDLPLHPLYESFAQREKVKSAAVLRFSLDKEPIACVFFNFNRQYDSPSRAILKSLNTFRNRFQKNLTRLFQQLSSQVPLRIRRIETLHRAAKCFPASHVGTSVEEYLHCFLKEVMSLYGISDNDFAAVYLVDAGDILQKRVQIGKVADDVKCAFSIRKREGIISASATRKTALLIRNPAETFDGHYISIDPANSPPTTCEVIIPLLVADRLIGVINIETKASQPGINELDIFDLTAVAFRLASSIHVASQTAAMYESRTMRLLDIASHSIAETAPAASNRQALQDWAAVVFGACSVSIWQWSDVEKQFSPGNQPESPRDCGFTKLIRELRCTVWWTESPDPEGLDVVFWNDQEAKWGRYLPAHCPLPDSVHEHLKGDGVVQQLGMPIIFRGRCVGVIWFKYRHRSTTPPMLDRMRLAFGIAAQVGVILQLTGLHEQFATELAVNRKLAEVRSSICKSGAFKFQGGDGFAISDTCGPIGGDFFASLELSDVTAFIVGDGEGHGLVGAMCMLPMYTAFRIATRDFQSPSHTLWEMSKLLDGVDDVRGTAICFAIDCSRENPRLIVSSAAHPKLLLVRVRGESLVVPEGEEEGFQINVAAGRVYDNLLEECKRELKAGDIIIAVTDGVEDSGKRYGRKNFDYHRIAAIVHDKPGGSAKEIAEAIQRAMLEHCHNDPYDDYTIVVLRISGT